MYADTPEREARPDRVRVPEVRWTHVALPCVDIDRTIAWYEKYTPLRLLDRREDAMGYGAWLGHPGETEHPFVLVLASFFADQEKGQPLPMLAPFAHIGIEMPTKEDVDEIARIGEADGCLSWAPQWMPDPIGYICALNDPDGNVIEFSFDQGVYEKAREVWGHAESRS
jgi:catechol 2,3-dioxygenase-like lactoylglutathione lyase family enzyme